MIKIGIIGAGYWGPNLIRNYDEIDTCQLKYVADLREGRLDFVKEKYLDIICTNDYKDILKDESIDAVVIATPVATHHKFGIEALKANKHVYIEKPFTASSLEARELVNLAEEKEKVLMVGHLFKYHPAVLKIKELLDNGVIGDIYYIDAARINMGPPESEANVIWDLAPHDLSIVLYLMGVLPLAVSATGNDFKTDQWKGLTQASYINLDFPNGSFVTIHNSWISPNKTRRLEIFGSKGVILYDELSDKKLTVFGEGIDSRKEGGSQTATNLAYGTGKMEYPEIPNGEPLKMECEHFLDCIVNNKIPRSDGVDGYNVVNAIEKANSSIAKNGIKLNF
jgi:predicted dehydrogenase